MLAGTRCRHHMGELDSMRPFSFAACAAMCDERPPCNAFTQYVDHNGQHSGCFLYEHAHSCQPGAVTWVSGIRSESFAV